MDGVQIQYYKIWKFERICVEKSHYLCDNDRPLAATFIEGCFQERRLIVRISFYLYSNLSSSLFETGGAPLHWRGQIPSTSGV